jgi:DNA-binding transcriptional LysR family regulator
MTLPSPPGAVAGRGAESGDQGPGVEFRQLRHFVCVAEELHFGRAAARLSMTQPGLSRSVAKLERALGVQLLQRSRRGVRLTDAGVELLRCARYLLADQDCALERTRSAGAGRAGVIRAGMALLAEQVIGPALAAWHAEYPGVVLERATAVSERLLAQLSQGSLHVAFVHQVPVLATLPRVDWEVVRRGPLAVLMTGQHRLAGRAGLTLAQLSGETFLVNPRELAPSAVQGLQLMCAEFGGFDPHVMESPAASAPTRDAGWRPVRQGAAIAVMAEETARALCPHDLTVVPVQPPPRYVIAAAWRRGDHHPPLERLLGTIRSYRDTNTWPAHAPHLSPRAQTSIGRLPGRPGFLGLAGA